MIAPLNIADLDPWQDVLPAAPADPRNVPVRHSNLKAMGQSPAHYRWACGHNLDPTLSMRLGSGTHALLFEKPVAVWTGKVRNGKVWEAFEKRYTVDEPATIVNLAEYRQAVAMVESVAVCKPARLLLETAQLTEHQIQWRNPLGGRECLSTIDAFGSPTLIELKSTRCSRPDRFSRDGMFRGYHAQLAWYLDALATQSYMPTDCYIIAVENVPPYVTTVLRVLPEAIEEGRKLNRLWLERVLACEASNEWPGYCQDVVEFEMGDVDGDFGLTVDGVETVL